MTRRRITWSHQAAHALEAQLPESAATACLEFISGVLVEQPRPVGKPLRGPLEGLRSARRGDYRVIYKIEDDGSLHVVAIRHRRDAYRT